MSSVARSRLLTGGLLLALALVLAACGGGGGGGGGQKEENKGGGGGSGDIAIEGSSTVLPITQAAAEAFRDQSSDVNITVGGAGTGDGFEAFCNGDTQISNASRPIKDEEAQTCQDNGVEFIELAVAQDGITVVVSPQNDFVQDITLDQLGTLWSPNAEGQVDSWNDVNPEWPDQPITL